MIEGSSPFWVGRKLKGSRGVVLAIDFRRTDRPVLHLKNAWF